MSKKRTITSLVIVIVVSLTVVGMVGRALWKKRALKKSEKILVELRTQVWPEESRRTAERVKQRQTVNETQNAATLNLTPFINAKLTDAPIGWKGQNFNNLSELPLGTNIYAGVPFDVQGSIHLMGGWLEHYQKTYPAKVENIPVHRRCHKIHLFHGNSSVATKDYGTTTSKVVLHYADGSTKELNMVSGAQVFDWWHPLFETAVNPVVTNTAPGTELAWTGTNPYIKQWQPMNSLALYRTTFDNPQPTVEISSLDYVSTLTMTCPFLLGITLE